MAPEEDTSRSIGGSSAWTVIFSRAALRARRDSDGTALKRDDVVWADRAPVTEAEDVRRTLARWEAAVDRTWDGGVLPEADVMP